MKLSNKVERWLDSLSSSNTHRNYKLALLKFCEDYNVTPDQTLTWSEEEIEDNIQDHITGLLKSGLAGSTTRIRLTGLKMWFRFNRIKIDPRVRNIPNGRTRLSYIPTRDDLRQALNAVGLKHKVMISLISFAGLRPVDIASLQYKHIRGSIDREDEVLTILKQHEKTDEWYVSFLGHQGTRYIRDYLKARGNLKDEDYLLVNSRKQPFKSKGIRVALETAIKRSIGKNPDDPIRTFRPYSLRKYFRRTLSKIGNEVAEYLMGHNAGLTSLTATYTGLRDLDPKAVEYLKEQYISILPELETELSELSINGKIHEQKEEQAQALEKRDRTIEELEKRLTDLQREQQEQVTELEQRMELLDEILKGQMEESESHLKVSELYFWMTKLLSKHVSDKELKENFDTVFAFMEKPIEERKEVYEQVEATISSVFPEGVEEAKNKRTIEAFKYWIATTPTDKAIERINAFELEQAKKGEKGLLWLLEREKEREKTPKKQVKKKKKE